MSYKVTGVETKTGTAQSGKNAGKPYTLYIATLEGTDIKPSGFEKVEIGDMVDITEKQNGQYTNHNFTKVKESTVGQGVSGTTYSNNSDPRAVKLLTLIAEQIGVDKQTILDVLDGKV